MLLYYDEHDKFCLPFLPKLDPANKQPVEVLATTLSKIQYTVHVKCLKHVISIIRTSGLFLYQLLLLLAPEQLQYEQGHQQDVASASW